MSEQMISLRRTALLLRDFFAARTREELVPPMPRSRPMCRAVSPRHPLNDAAAAGLEYAFTGFSWGRTHCPRPRTRPSIWMTIPCTWPEHAGHARPAAQSGARRAARRAA